MSWLERRRDTNSGQYRRLILGPIERTRRPVSRVLYPPARAGGRRPFLWDVRCRTPRATYPGGRCGSSPARRARRRGRRRPYLVLLPVGFTVPPLSPGARCALTAPFHPYRVGAGATGTPGHGRFAFCGTFPGVAPAGRYPAPRFRGARTFLPPASGTRGRATVRPSGPTPEVSDARQSRKRGAGCPMPSHGISWDGCFDCPQPWLPPLLLVGGEGRGEVVCTPNARGTTSPIPSSHEEEGG